MGSARTALFTGSFDPVTNGHLDVIRQACRVVDRIVIAIGIHSSKTPVFSAEERAEMLRDVCEPVARSEGAILEVATFTDLAIDAARRSGAAIIVRGLRDGTDLDYEMQMAAMNAVMAPEIQTVFCRGLARRSPHHRHAGAPDRRHGRRRVVFRAAACRRPPESQTIPALSRFIDPRRTR